MSWAEGEKERISLSNSSVMKSWVVEEENHTFILSSRGYYPGSMEEMEQKAREILDQAKLQAKEIMEQAYQEGFEQGRQKGYQAGYESGHESGLKAGEAEGLQKTEAGCRQVLELVYCIEMHRRELMLEWEKDVKKLAVAIAEKVIHTQVNLDEETIVQATKAAINALVSPKWINLHVNPRDGELLLKHKKAVSEDISGDIPLKIMKNPELPPGSCSLETDKGILDASINTQILEIKKALEIA